MFSKYRDERFPEQASFQLFRRFLLQFPGILCPLNSFSEFRYAGSLCRFAQRTFYEIDGKFRKPHIIISRLACYFSELELILYL